MCLSIQVEKKIWMQLQSPKWIPSKNKCLTSDIVCKAKVSNETNNEGKRYLGASETPFKGRFRNHTRKFIHKTYEKCTELSKYIWTLKSYGITPIVTWSFAQRIKTAANFCKLCLIESFYIIRSLDDKNVLNKKSELVTNVDIKINY